MDSLWSLARGELCWGRGRRGAREERTIHPPPQDSRHPINNSPRLDENPLYLYSPLSAATMTAQFTNSHQSCATGLPTCHRWSHPTAGPGFLQMAFSPFSDETTHMTKTSPSRPDRFLWMVGWSVAFLTNERSLTRSIPDNISTFLFVIPRSPPSPPFGHAPASSPFRWPYNIVNVHQIS